jgi:hypothetical protein
MVNESDFLQNKTWTSLSDVIMKQCIKKEWMEGREGGGILISRNFLRQQICDIEKHSLFLCVDSGIGY